MSNDGTAGLNYTVWVCGFQVCGPRFQGKPCRAAAGFGFRCSVFMSSNSQPICQRTALLIRFSHIVYCISLNGVFSYIKWI